ncbi:ABC transporter permease [Acuticoccus sp. 2012]|uniref:ABC transporter permease n=2 Tax=Acuticoccus mangrovi TaxID=2796142 RepID=A0A934MFL9_9HYPH|nr:ABC transporter permease [Acuticoccus mangrovi]MBJ3778797.1 ABC transporter permease [Acuticoccus mangrovi]
MGRHDLWLSFRSKPVVIVAAIVAGVLILSALAAPLIAPHDPYDMASVSLLYAELPPAWVDGGDPAFPLGTDLQGRDMLSTILYGSRTSILVGAAAVALSLVLGVAAGLVAGYGGGVVDSVLMRIADIQLTFPAILIALLFDGVVSAIFSHGSSDQYALLVIILAIGVSNWVLFARVVRSSTLVEKGKDYVKAARVTGVSSLAILLKHILPNTLGPVLVIATINLALAILGEATLSFLGVGLPPTQPSLGTLIRIGNEYLFSGAWWMTIFPGVTLILLVLSVNLLGDWLRDALNPKLR